MDDKRELLKLKQGLIDHRDSTITKEKYHIVKPTGKKAVENFIYHHKLHLVMGAFFAVIIAVFIYFALSTEKSDIKIMLVSDNHETSSFFYIEKARLERAIEQYTPDFNGDGKIHSECLFIDLMTEGRHPDAVQGDRTKLFAEVFTGDVLIYIGNKEALEGIPGEQMNAEDFYRGGFHKVKDTCLADFGFDKVPIPDDLYIVIRNIDTSQSGKAMQIFRNIVK
jgi:hypothetical protein